METIQKKDIIDDLFTLRAGLSLISEQKDKCDEIDNNYKMKKRKKKEDFFRDTYLIDLDSIYPSDDIEQEPETPCVGQMEAKIQYDCFIRQCKRLSKEKIQTHFLKLI